MRLPCAKVAAPTHVISTLLINLPLVGHGKQRLDYCKNFEENLLNEVMLTCSPSLLSSKLHKSGTGCGQLRPTKMCRIKNVNLKDQDHRSICRVDVAASTLSLPSHIAWHTLHPAQLQLYFPFSYKANADVYTCK